MLQAAEWTNVYFWPCVGPVDPDLWPVGHDYGAACRHAFSPTHHHGLLETDYPVLTLCPLQNHHAAYDSSATMVCMAKSSRLSDLLLVKPRQADEYGNDELRTSKISAHTMT